MLGREQCGDADECGWSEQGDPKFRAGAGTAFLDHRHLVESPAGDVGGEFRDVIERASSLGDGSGDVEVTLLYLCSKVTFAYGFRKVSDRASSKPLAAPWS